MNRDSAQQILEACGRPSFKVGDVEVSIADTPLGRIDLELLEHVK